MGSAIITFDEAVARPVLLEGYEGNDELNGVCQTCTTALYILYITS